MILSNDLPSASNVNSFSMAWMEFSYISIPKPNIAISSNCDCGDTRFFIICHWNDYSYLFVYVMK